MNQYQQMENAKLKSTNTIEIVFAGCIWLTLYSAEFIANFGFRYAKSPIDYYYIAIVATTLFALLAPLLGKKPIVADIVEICWYDVFVQLFGLISCILHWSETAYWILAHFIIILKMARVTWPIFNQSIGMPATWPTFGVMGFLRKLRTGNAAPKLLPRQRLHVLGLIIVWMVCAVGMQQISSVIQLPVASIVTMPFVMIYSRHLIAKLEQREEEALAAIQSAAAAEKELALANERLKSQAIIEAKNAELEAKNRALDEYARQQAAIAQDLAQRNESLRDASHDVKQPITKLRYYTDRALLMVQDEAQRPFLQAIETGLNDVSRLMHSVIDQAKANTLLMKPQIHPIAVPELVDYFERNFAPEAQAAGIFFEQRSEDCMILSNDVLLKRIISNLVDNAIRHGQQGTCAKLRFYAAGSVCHIRIMDKGPGIADANGPNRAANFVALVERLKKEQADPDAMPDSRHGLGLISVLRVCDELGITLRMRSAPEKGTVFHFTVPLASKT